MSYARFSSDNWRSDVYVYADCQGGFQCWLAGFKHDGDLPEPLPFPKTGEPFDAWAKRDQEIMAALQALPRRKIDHGLGTGHHTDTAEEMAEWLETVARPAGLHVPQYAIDELRHETEEEGDDVGA